MLVTMATKICSATSLLFLLLYFSSTSAIEENRTSDDCGPRLLNATEEQSGLLHSPNYPGNYPPNSECWWTITAPVGYHVMINFTAFQTEPCFSIFSDCDEFQLHDEPPSRTSNESYQDLKAANVLARSLLSHFHSLTLKFASNGYEEAKGFELTYKAVAIGCPTLVTPSDGKKLCYIDRNTDGIHCSFNCFIGYRLSGNARRSCQSDGSWNGSSVTCDKITSCLEGSEVYNGNASCTDGNNIGSTCNFTCDEGYKLFGNRYQTCYWAGYWEGPFFLQDPSCQSSPPTPTCSNIGVEVCDGRYDCPDRSDEKGCTCPRSKFKCDCHDTGCPTTYSCIHQRLRCNEVNDCGDWSDERDCQCSDTRFQCRDGDCIDRSKVNDGNIDCVNGDDEFICNKTQGHVSCDCMHDDDQCRSSGRCIPNSWIGDTIPDCENHNDEPCNASKVWCNGCWVVVNRCWTNQSKNVLLRPSLLNMTKCQTTTILSSQNQHKFPTIWICITSHCAKCFEAFQCKSGQFINIDYYCDTISHCYDGSDEELKEFGFRCAGKSRTSYCVLPQKNVYDAVAQCADKSDLCFVDGEFRCFSCLDGKLIISAKQVCDGMIDCYDMSDECLCANQSVCNAVLGEKMSRCPSDQMHCNNDKDCVDMDKVLCNSSVACKGRINLDFCHQKKGTTEIITCSSAKSDIDLNLFPFIFPGDVLPPSSRETIRAARCDGRPECWGMEDECDCEPRPPFCDGECASKTREVGGGNRVCDGQAQKYNILDPCEKELETHCPMRFYCKSKDKISIDKRSVCDGIIDCDDHSDENSTDCINTRFFCIKGDAFSVSKAFVCDGINDCDNGEDETRQLCEERRFYCESGQPLSVDIKLLENGIKDCLDGSDECVSFFSNRYEMIANPTLRALFWIMGLLALIGNVIINIYTAKDIFFRKDNNAVKLAKNVFILNLTVSDFLMGVYLIAIVGQGVKYSGKYCFVDKKWRSSNLCSGLGTLAVLSSETSAFIMAAMSSLRLVRVYKPVLSSSIKIKSIIISVSSCWIFSSFLAFIPWFPFDSGFFISDVWFPCMFLKTNVVSKLDMFTLANHTSNISITTTVPTSWFDVKTLISRAFKYNPIKGEFGYYGDTSVCMPRFFASTNEAAWQYSVLLITLNLFLFVYMAVAYVLVYKKASVMKRSRSMKNDPNKEMQNRISRLLLTDFCCWIPVCIMGYLSVAGVHLPPTAYIVSAGFLLPINSAMNPILYSKQIGRQASRAKKWIIQKLPCVHSSPVDEVHVAERLGTRDEVIELKPIEVNN